MHPVVSKNRDLKGKAEREGSALMMQIAGNGAQLHLFLKSVLLSKD